MHSHAELGSPRAAHDDPAVGVRGTTVTSAGDGSSKPVDSTETEHERLKTRKCYGNDGPANAEQGFCDNVVIVCRARCDQVWFVNRCWCAAMLLPPQTSKYTAANFLPRFLFEQFSRFANLYFLIVCILQLIPAISITSGVPTAGVPLSFVLFFDGLVTAREDFQRHKDDARANAKPARVLREGTFVPVRWQDICVGDVCRVRGGEELAADMVLLTGAHEGTANPDVCHVMTAQLDGETNLKLRKALAETVDAFAGIEAEEIAKLSAFTGFVECEEPTEFFDKFTGAAYLARSDTKGHALSADATLLRGCVLRNVDYIFGLVVYTGNQTKVRVKQQEQKVKKALVEGVINQNILRLVGLLALLCLAGTIGYIVFTSNSVSTHWYLLLAPTNFGDVVSRFLTFFLLNANFIPVSLYVSMKISRQTQKLFMQLDETVVYTDEKVRAVHAALCDVA